MGHPSPPLPLHPSPPHTSPPYPSTPLPLSRYPGPSPTSQQARSLHSPARMCSYPLHVARPHTLLAQCPYRSRSALKHPYLSVCLSTEEDWLWR